MFFKGTIQVESRLRLPVRTTQVPWEQSGKLSATLLIIFAKQQDHLTLTRDGAYPKKLIPGDCDSSDACIRLSDGRVIFCGRSR